MSNQKSINELFDLASKSNVDIEIIEMSSSGGSISYLEKQPDEVSHGESYGLGVRIVREDKESFFSSESNKTEDLKALFDQQVEALEFAKPNENIILNESFEDSEQPEIYFENSISKKDKMQKVEELENKLWSCDSNVKKVRGTTSSESFSNIRLFNKNKEELSYKKSFYSISSEILGEKDGKLASGHYTHSVHDLDDMISDDQFVERIKKHSIGLLGAKSPETGEYPIVIERKCFAKILGLILPMLQADTVDKGFSLFDDKVGEKIASGLLQIEDDPFNYKGLGRKPFDGEGNKAKKFRIIEDGVLKGFLSNKEYSAKLGIENTHNAVRSGNGKVGIGTSNVIVRSGTLATSAIKAMKPKLIEVVRLNGLHAGFNSVTGDFSFQSEGFLYEMGELISPLQDFVIAGNVKDLIMGIEDLGASVSDHGSSIICPDALVASMKVIGS